MGIVRLVGVSATGANEKCEFEVAFAVPPVFGPVQLDGNGEPFFEITPAAGGVKPFAVRAKPKNSELWTVQGHFFVDDKGVIKKLKAPPGSFFFRGAMQVGTGFASVLVAQLSIFKDVTEVALDELKAVPANQMTNPPQPDAESVWPPNTWVAPTATATTLPPASVLRAQSVTFTNGAGSPQTFAQCVGGSGGTYSPKATVRVLERTGNALPKRVVVAWDESLPRDASAAATPYFIFFTHLLNQNKAGFAPHLDVYPTSWGYAWLSIWRYLNYSGDIANSPIGAHFSRGLLPQIAASGKKVVLVIPVGDASKAATPEVGDFTDATKLRRILAEIDAFMFREEGLERAPNTTLGPCAMASFSSGNNQLAVFLASSSNQGTKFYKDDLREVYSFDNPRSSVPAFAANALNWMQAGASSTKALRLYGTHYGTYASLFPTVFPKEAAPTPEQPFVSASTKLPNRTLAVLPEPCWGPDYGVTDGQGVHQLICATMVLDALRRSPNF